MSLRTKKALEESLKKLLRIKTLEKITIQELAKEANVSRMTFYYHYNDIYELARYVSEQDAIRVENKSGGDAKQHFINIFNMFSEEKDVLTNIYASLSRENVEGYLRKSFKTVIEKIVKPFFAEANYDSKEFNLTVYFCMSAVIGCAIDWFENGLKEPAEQFAEKLYWLVQCAAKNSICES